MRQSNSYIIFFSIGLTVVLGGLLALAATALKPAQQASVKLDTQKQILSAVMDIQSLEPAQVEKVYADQIASLIINAQGEEVTTNAKGETVQAEKVDIRKEFKKISNASKLSAEAAELEAAGNAEKAKAKKDEAAALMSEVLLPVFRFKPSADAADFTAYILPTYGNGLWNNIWGYVALKSDMNTIAGISLDHVGETPGLGARITEGEVQSRYEGKTIYDNGKLVSVTMVKGENNTGLNEHQVDGMSGATLTANGVNAMLQLYLQSYQPYLEKVKGGAEAPKTGMAIAE